MRCRLPALAAALLAGLVGVAGLTAPPSQAAVSLYAANRVGADIAQYQVNKSSGLLTPMAAPTAPAEPGGMGRLVAVAPNGRWAYLANTASNPAGNDVVSQYSVSQVDGSLTPMSPATVASGNGPIGMAVTPNNRFAFAAVSFGSEIQRYSIDQTTGALTQLSPLAIGAASSMQKIQITPDGAYLYSTDFNGQSVRQFALDQTTGTLTPLTPATVAITGSVPRPVTMAMSTDAKHLYVASTNASAISQFNIGAGGLLTPMSPATVAAHATPRGMVVSPDGSQLFVGDGSAAGKIDTYAIDASSGALTLSRTGAGTGATRGLALTADGRHLYTSDGTNGRVSQFSVDPLGIIAPLSPAQLTADSDTWGVTLSPNQGPTAGFTVTPGAASTPTSFDATSSTDDSAVASYDWDFGDGATLTTSSPTVQHTYAVAGNYTASVRVTDDDGCSTTANWAGTTVYCRPSGAATAAHGVTVAACGTGGLNLSTPATLVFPATTLTGVDQSVGATTAVTIDDQTGTGNGWRLSGTSTTFSSGASTLPTTATTLTGATATTLGGSCVAPTSAVSYPVSLPAGPVAPAAVTLFSAAALTGKGPVSVALDFNLALPADTRAGTYSSAWTMTLSTGP